MKKLLLLLVFVIGATMIWNPSTNQLDWVFTDGDPQPQVEYRINAER